jgi:hypothetical protein
MPAASVKPWTSAAVVPSAMVHPFGDGDLWGDGGKLSPNTQKSFGTRPTPRPPPWAAVGIVSGEAPASSGNRVASASTNSNAAVVTIRVQCMGAPPRGWMRDGGWSPAHPAARWERGTPAIRLAR